MTLTRSGRTIGAAKKIKFSDDGELPSGAKALLVTSRESTQEPEQVEVAPESESDEDSDDAPEEESVSQSKSAVLQKLKEQEKLEQKLRKEEREKRKQRDLHFKQQQDAKREKIKDLVAAEELPDLLPEEALESDNEDDVSSTTQNRNGKHLRTEDFEKEDAAMRKKMKLEKLRKLKEMRNQALKKGPVYVQVHNENTSKNRVPRAEQSVIASKSQWLQRDSLNRK